MTLFNTNLKILHYYIKKKAKYGFDFYSSGYQKKALELNYLTLGNNKLFFSFPTLFCTFYYTVISTIDIIEKRKKPTFPLNKIGPHSYETLCIIFGTLLGDGHAQKRGNTTRINIRQCSEHKEHLFSLWEYFSTKGYTSPHKPVLKSYIHNKTKKIIYHYAFDTYSYASFNWIRDAFYNDKVKVVPNCISDFLSARALAVWLMDDGNFEAGGVKINTQDFTKNEILFLCSILRKKYKLKCSLNKAKYSKKKKCNNTLYI